MAKQVPLSETNEGVWKLNLFVCTILWMFSNGILMISRTTIVAGEIFGMEIINSVYFLTLKRN